MIIYQGIQLVYAHVVQLINTVSTWFTGIDWVVWTDLLPHASVVTPLIAIVLTMSCIGLIKKMSFLLG